jgi:hypothetical protein
MTMATAIDSRWSDSVGTAWVALKLTKMPEIRHRQRPPGQMSAVNAASRLAARLR